MKKIFEFIFGLFFKKKVINPIIDFEAIRKADEELMLELGKLNYLMKKKGLVVIPI